MAVQYDVVRVQFRGLLIQCAQRLPQRGCGDVSLGAGGGRGATPPCVLLPRHLPRQTVIEERLLARVCVSLVATKSIDMPTPSVPFSKSTSPSSQNALWFRGVRVGPPHPHVRRRPAPVVDIRYADGDVYGHRTTVEIRDRSSSSVSDSPPARVQRRAIRCERDVGEEVNDDKE